MSRYDPYREKLGIAFIGGCGTNNARRIIDTVNPEHYPGLNLWVGNTDLRIIHTHFGDVRNPNPSDTNLLRWINARRLVVHQLGENVTHGRGAGADENVGRRSAETPESMEAMRSFFGDMDALLIATGLGGGTGTGATPVAAELARSITTKDNEPLPTVVLATMPANDDGRNSRADGALKALQSLVPTVPIQNQALEEYLTGMSESERDKFKFSDMWQLVNDQSLLPPLLLLREIIQETGDQINIDLADYRKVLKYGNHLLSNRVMIPSEGNMDTAAIVHALSSPRFQDQALLSTTDVMMFWFHGPWPYAKARTIVREVKQKAVRSGKTIDMIEAHLGVRENVTDDELWVGLVAVAKELPGPKFTSLTDAMPRSAQVIPLPVQRITKEEPVITVNTPPKEETLLKSVEYFVDGEPTQRLVLPKLADQFREAWAIQPADDAERKALRERCSIIGDEIAKFTRGKKPDLPLQSLDPVPEPVPEPRRGFFSLRTKPEADRLMARRIDPSEKVN